MQSLIESIALGIALPLVLWLISKFMPYKLPAEAHPLTLELLRNRYARWDWVAMILIFIFVPLLGYVCYDVLNAVAVQQVKQFEGEPSMKFSLAILPKFRLRSNSISPQQPVMQG